MMQSRFSAGRDELLRTCVSEIVVDMAEVEGVRALQGVMHFDIPPALSEIKRIADTALCLRFITRDSKCSGLLASRMTKALVLDVRETFHGISCYSLSRRCC